MQTKVWKTEIYLYKELIAYVLKISGTTMSKYRTTSFSALSSFSATPRLVRPPKTKKCVIVRPLV